VNTPISLVSLTFGAALGLMVFVWLLSLVKRDASIVDTFWGLGFVLIAWIACLVAEGFSGRKILITGLTTVWGLRLAAHIFWRGRGKGEDRRYQAWRARYGESFWWVSLFTVFGLQAVLLWVISLVLQVGQLSPTPERLGWLDWAGASVWAAGFAFEAISDGQLLRFKADPANRGKIMDRGLWAYSRHPNYFGECLVWWGIFLVTLSTPGSAWSVVSPLTITFLLLKVSGVTLLEKTILETRPAYRDYMERTSPFIPWPGRRKKP